MEGMKVGDFGRESQERETVSMKIGERGSKLIKSDSGRLGGHLRVPGHLAA